MESLQNTHSMLDMLQAPAFCVENGVVGYANPAAQQRLICQGSNISDMLSTGKAEYAALDNGCVFLSLTVSGCTYNATAVKKDGLNVFVLEEPGDSAPLQILALAARELRMPLGGIYTDFDRLLCELSSCATPSSQELAASISRRIDQLSRLVGNMSSAISYQSPPAMEVRDITAIFDEIFQGTIPLAETLKKTLRFQNLNQRVFCHLNEEMVERTAYNLLSNAMRFTPEGGWIDAKLTKRDNFVCLTITDSGSGIPSGILSNVFNRYLRAPAIEDGNYGIGLGMLLIRSTASAHGGTVLVEQPREGGPRIAVSFSLEPPAEPVLRSPLQVDYAGGREHRLIELSDVLPASAYKRS